MPIFQRTIKAIQHADDGPGALGAGEDTEALTWNNGTGKFVTSAAGGGGGNVAYTDVANVFTRMQTVQSSIDDITLSGDFPDNPGFDGDLSFWTDTFSAGWNWASGAALKTPGIDGDLTQSGIGINENELYVFAAQVTGMTAGVVEISVVDGESTVILLSFSADGTQSDYAILVGPTIDISIYADEFFDGRVEYVSLKSSTGGFPANILLKDFAGNYAGEIKSSSNKLIIGNINNSSAQIIQLAGQIIDISALSTSPGAPGTAWVDEANDNVVKRA